MYQEDSGLKKNGWLMPPAAAVSPPLTSIASSSIGVHLRVTGHCSQGGRKYMEDFFSVAYHESKSTKDLEYAFVGIYDGHGGSEAAAFAKEHLMMEIINQKLFWSDSDEDVLSAIREGYKATHYAMWREQENWPKTSTGLPSTSGTTATVAFIRHEKIYIGHVGDSGIVLGYQNSNESFWRAKQLTLDHKPENALEKIRIMNSGGKVVAKSGVPRVVWNRPSVGHKGPVRRSTPIDEIPFLAVARSLGDLWSYNSELNKFIVSPDPDVKVIKINTETFRCLIFGTDGLWNVVTPEQAVETVREKEITNGSISNERVDGSTRCNPSRSLVENALKKWSSKKMRADNTSVVTVIFYPTENSATKTNSPYNLASSHGLEYMQINIERNPSDDHLQNSFQKFQPNADNNIEQQLLDIDIHDQIHELSHNETIATNTTIAKHLQQHSSSQNRYNQIFFGFENIASCNNYKINSDDTEHLYYDDQVSNNFINSFVESYNSLLTTNKERENNIRFNASSVTISGEKKEIDPCKYDSYNSLHHTGLAGHDRVHHHHPNNEFQIEQQMYQEQCMSAEEGYCLTKLETRVEQQLRGTINKQTTANSFEIFLGGRTDELAEESYNQYNYGSNNFQKVFNCSETLTSHLLSSNEDDTRCYKPTGSEKSPYLWADNVIKTTSLHLGSSIDQSFSSNTLTKPEIEKVISDGIENQNVDETIQIHEISSSVVEITTPSSDPLTYCKTHIPKTISDQIPGISHTNSVGSTHFIKASLSKLALYPNVPNENHRTLVRPLTHQYPKTFQKRMLRSMTDYSKRTLRSRNNLFKELKSKNTPSTNRRKLNGVHSKCMKSTSPSNVENSSSVISKKCLTLRSRTIKTKSAVFSEPDVMYAPKNSNGMHERKSKLRSFVASTNQSLTTTNRNNCNSSTTFKSIGLRGTLSTSSHQQASISFAKRSSIKNSGWASGKTPMQTRNHVHKRMSR